MKTLILGATGMIGANIAEQLGQSGNIRILARSPEKAKSILGPAYEIVEGDITDESSLQSAMEGVELVYHAAGLPEQWFKDVGIFDRVNHQGTRKVMNAALQKGVSRLVYTSTIDVFAGLAHKSYDESVIDEKPKGTYYERSKQAADRAAVEAIKSGLDVVFTHPSGLFGPGPVGSPGSNDFIADLINKKVPLLLPGGFPLVFSEDCARGHILAAQKAKTGDRFILSDAYFSLEELANVVKSIRPETKVPSVMPLWFAKLFSASGELKARITGKSPMLPAGQLHFLQWQAIPSAEHAKRVLDWAPTETTAAIKQTIEFLVSQGRVAPKK